MRISDWSSDVCSSDLTQDAMTTARFNMPLSGIDPPVKKRAAIAPSPISIIYWQILCQYIPQRQCAGWLQRLADVDGADRAGDTERGGGAENQPRRNKVARREQPPETQSGGAEKR